MAKRIGISASEMLQLREQGYSNADIANLLEISRATVQKYIGSQGGAYGQPGSVQEAKGGNTHGRTQASP